MTIDPCQSVRFEEDDEGWWNVECSCRYVVSGLPDQETAVDVLMEHAFARGLRAGRGE